MAKRSKANSAIKVQLPSLDDILNASNGAKGAGIEAGMAQFRIKPGTQTVLCNVGVKDDSAIMLSREDSRLVLGSLERKAAEEVHALLCAGERPSVIVPDVAAVQKMIGAHVKARAVARKAKA